MDWTTPDLCDTHPEVQVAEPLFRGFGGRVAFHGAIATVRCHEDNSRVRELAGTPGQGRVMVVDGGGSLRRALLGDQIAATAARNGWTGFLIHGAVRDVEVLAQLDLGVQALAAHPMKTEKRGLGEVDVPVRFAGVDFHPGHWLYADANGVIVSARKLV
ncbi:ribonuclease E activity regulator RraA [Pseudoxanthomonas beigongshangi]|jgi:regulator of ribonuclease activity A|uniref:ribonuclease E activity regulator RraA n=1 Tax=Pseudoxanthomonas beigongshangi TaxID=2782537 RepID=UPI00193B1C0F|nr:ribonuclease E activity regulator RraA [Pseudoxanthomonas beigongshangi]UBB24095.1 ribonuclease E activity regulator RraA [Pseudoxanthomonas japonensis]